MNQDIEIEELLDWINPLKEKAKESKQKANAYEIFYRSYFEKDLKRIMLEYLLRRDQYANTPEDLMVNKGIMKGLEIIKKHFDEQINLSLSRLEENDYESE